MNGRSKAAIVPGLIFLAVFFIYTRTLNPVFHADDSPETIACSYTLGIQHPPGYPLPTLVGKAFSFIPAGNAGFRINLQSAFFGALLAALIYLIIMDTLKGKNTGMFLAGAASAIASFSFSFSYTLWNQALSAKGGIYTLNSFLLAIVIIALFQWERSKQYRFFYFACFTYGLSLGNHWESMAVAFPALFVFIVLVFIKDGYYKTITPKRFLSAAFLGFLPLFLYLYLIIRARSGAFMNWGDPVDLKQLLWVVTRAEYTSLEQAKDLQVILKQVGRIGRLLFFEFSAAGFLVFAAGIKGFLDTGRKQRLVMFSLLFLTVLLSLSFYLNLKDEMIWIMDVFLIPAYMAMAVVLGTGVYSLIRNAEFGMRNLLNHKSQITNPKSQEEPATRNPISVILVVLFGLLPIYLIFVNYSKADQQRYYYAYDFGMNIIRSIGASPAVAMLEGDYAVMPQMYFKYVQKKVSFCPVTTIFLYVPWSLKNLRNECPDIKITMAGSASLGDKIKDIVAGNYREREIYTSVFRPAFTEYYPEGNAMLMPYGLVMRMSADKAGSVRRSEENLRLLSYRGLLDDRLYMDASTQFGMSNYASAYMETGNALASLNADAKALDYLTRATALATVQTKAMAYTHLGIEYSKLGKYDVSLGLYQKAIAINPSMTEAYSNMAGIYNNQKKYDKSIETCEIALKINPKFSEVYNNMAIAYYNKGDRAKAVALMEKAVQLSPGNPLAKRNLQILKGEIK